MGLLSDTLSTARARLVAAGIRPDDAAVDVHVYARTILGWDEATLLANLREPTPRPLEPRFSQWIARRETCEPTAYILGTREFWGRPFLVTPAVLVPRPETEFIVEEALPLVRDLRAPRLADIGTGSGILAVTLAAEMPEAAVVATDLSGAALVVARENAKRHGVAGRVTFVETSYLNGINGLFDLVVANPPYVRDLDRPALARDVRHEPDVALFGGPDGLRDVGGVLDAAVATVKPGGWFVMEFGYGQEEDVRRLVHARPSLRVERVREDLQGIARTAVVQKAIL
ncbi:MAG TPA: peptide chain release factor N(5)-glutamine methyltransferase [Vicinamibacterales bacterium]|jgi:release factor glutamine methyltransferase|nr:peptide chain release factor N(5)-glutamine methyltransferase [Vicinamibacterales bacterium]